jgi:glutamine amidotransferase
MLQMTRILILDYGMGNIFSVQKKIKALGLNPIISNSEEDILNADKIIFPGVGHFSNAMENLKKLNVIQSLNEKVLGKKTPVLGICLGMQLMAQNSEEGNLNGLGWFDATVKKFNIQDKLNFKVPQMGWNTISINKKSDLMIGIPDQSELYFIHSFYIECSVEKDILTKTVYESEFVSAIQKDNIFGVQYHPEKSHEIGEKMLKNFIEI